MNWRRTLIFIAALDLAATIFLPREGYSRLRDQELYQFVFVPRQWSAPIDYEQWRLNVGVATLIGFLLAQVPLGKRK